MYRSKKQRCWNFSIMQISQNVAAFLDGYILCIENKSHPLYLNILCIRKKQFSDWIKCNNTSNCVLSIQLKIFKIDTLIETCCSVFTGWEQNNRYLISNSLGQQVLFAMESKLIIHFFQIISYREQVSFSSSNFWFLHHWWMDLWNHPCLCLCLSVNFISKTIHLIFS